MSGDFLDALEARLPGEVDRRARTVDRRRVARAIHRALAPAPKKPVRTKIWIGLAAAAVLIAATAAAATTYARHVPATPTTVPATPEPTVAKTEAQPTPAFEPAMSVDDLPRVAPIAAAEPQQESAADLFARANHSRQSGDAPAAVALYRTLEKKFPSSAEANVAHVSLARLLLERDAAGALAELDVYLAGGATELREEALALRARAFATLGRGVEEKRAWQMLLAEHPDSLYASRAKERIETP